MTTDKEKMFQFLDDHFGALVLGVNHNMGRNQFVVSECFSSFLGGKMFSKYSFESGFDTMEHVETLLWCESRKHSSQDRWKPTLNDARVWLDISQRSQNHAP